MSPTTVTATASRTLRQQGHQHAGSLSPSHSSGVSTTTLPTNTRDLWRRRFKMQRTPTDDQSISRDEAEWFLSLPDKIKRRHFSPEEQIWMRARSELAMLPAGSRHPAAQRAKSSGCDTRPPAVPVMRQSSLPSCPSAISLPQSHDSMHQQCFELVGDTPFEPLRLNLDSWSPPPPIRPTQSPALSLSSSSSVNAMNGLPRVHQTAAPPSLAIDTSTAIYIGDVENMSKVRDYLSSPCTEPASAVSKHTGPFDGSFFDPALNDDDASSADDKGPVTPLDTVSSRLDSSKSSYFALAPTGQSTASQFDNLLSRDVTLKLTLTRPELRADHDGPQDRLASILPVDELDPLALEKLTFSDDTSGQQGVFARDAAASVGKRNRIKGLWRANNGVRWGGDKTG